MDRSVDEHERCCGMPHGNHRDQQAAKGQVGQDCNKELAEPAHSCTFRSLGDDLLMIEVAIGARRWRIAVRWNAEHIWAQVVPRDLRIRGALDRQAPLRRNRRTVAVKHRPDRRLTARHDLGHASLSTDDMDGAGKC